MCICRNWTFLFSDVEKLPGTVGLWVKKEKTQDLVISLTLASITTVRG